jgi:Asp-tRNA(Asn)/Glu-tRNA(Gln) amidotransferase A subunit family amidase
MTDVLDLTASDMAHAVREREVAPVDLVDTHIAHIEAADPSVNTVVVRRGCELEDALGGWIDPRESPRSAVRSMSK